MNEVKPHEQPPEPLDIEGRPLNVLIQLQGTAAAYVRTAEIKQAYDAIVPSAVPAAPAVAPDDPRLEPPEGEALSPDDPRLALPDDIGEPPAPEPPEAPLGPMISAGRRVVPKGNYVTDTEIRKRTL